MTDIGLTDMGYFGMDLNGATPNMDLLATQGLRLSSLYGSIGCSPGRACALTGRCVGARGGA